MDIGDRIKKRRLELGMTQDELAKAAGYKWRSSINKIELGGQKLPQIQIEKIAKALKVTPSYLAGWEEEEYITEEGKSYLASELLARDEEMLEKYFKLSIENRETLIGIIDTLLQAQTRKEQNDD